MTGSLQMHIFVERCEWVRVDHVSGGASRSECAGLDGRYSVLYAGRATFVAAYALYTRYEREQSTR